MFESVLKYSCLQCTVSITASNQVKGFINITVTMTGIERPSKKLQNCFNTKYIHFTSLLPGFFCSFFPVPFFPSLASFEKVSS